MQCIACENIRFSSLFVAEDVSRGGTSATQRQKFHTDDVEEAFEFCWSSWGDQRNTTKIDQKTRKIRQIYIWNPMTTGFIT